MAHLVSILITAYFLVGIGTSLYMMVLHPVAKYAESNRAMAIHIGGMLFGWWLWPILLPSVIIAHKGIHANPSRWGAHACDKCGTLAVLEEEDGPSFRCKVHGERDGVQG